MNGTEIGANGKPAKTLFVNKRYLMPLVNNRS
jgi:hypothetical protein